MKKKVGRIVVVVVSRIGPSKSGIYFSLGRERIYAVPELYGQIVWKRLVV